ncbi:hypothetical protein Poli38472_005079 [Pythium oligandrum]|uniref:PI3K/PI4K catalytic domain-containing protein n=1 Tax=Pythium oligandrum TaxID=41045 RepID=A0A8K1FH90_PYTOL|nr:hypothetical protein Poli38472_005079 [Pythium oligandrum]|eukprot:TMW62461.1 hypothetical protein Poli38472_005079 [Pythium oligandrum]
MEATPQSLASRRSRRSFTEVASDDPIDPKSARRRRHSIALGPVLIARLVREHRALELKEIISPRGLPSYQRRLFVDRKRSSITLKTPRETQRCELSIIRSASVNPTLTDLEHRIQPIISDVLEGFRANVGPIPVDDGTGGVYFLRTKAQRITAVFKPADEEPFAMNNPKHHRANSASVDVEGIRRGIPPGGAAIREVAAYLLDHGHAAGVPPTMLVSASHHVFYRRKGSSTGVETKVGSMQLYVPHDCTADDVSERLLSIEQVHAMAVLDIRLANQDRHGGNVLVVSKSTPADARSYHLIPIDHGACLPLIRAMEETSFLWLEWPQSKTHFSASILERIASLEATKDVQMLAESLPTTHQLAPEALLTLVICTTLLQECALRYEMTAFDIGTLMYRASEGDESVLERLVRETIDPSVMIPSPTSEEWETFIRMVQSRFRDALADHMAFC